MQRLPDLHTKSSLFEEIKACLDMSIRMFFEFLEVAQDRLYFDLIGYRYGTALEVACTSRDEAE
jgi:hypothetical protein